MGPEYQVHNDEIVDVGHIGGEASLGDRAGSGPGILVVVGAALVVSDAALVDCCRPDIATAAASSDSKLLGHPTIGLS